MYKAVVRVSIWEVDVCIFHRSGDDGRVVNDAANVHQRAVIRIADRARLRDAGRERSFLGAGLELPVWAEIYDPGFAEAGPIAAKGGGRRRRASVRQLLRESYAKRHR